MKESIIQSITSLYKVQNEIVLGAHFPPKTVILGHQEKGFMALVGQLEGTAVIGYELDGEERELFPLFERDLNNVEPRVRTIIEENFKNK